MHALRLTCIIKKAIKNKPVSAITHFLPIEEVNNSDHFIFMSILERVIRFRQKYYRNAKYKGKVTAGGCQSLVGFPKAKCIFLNLVWLGTRNQQQETSNQQHYLPYIPSLAINSPSIFLNK